MKRYPSTGTYETTEGNRLPGVTGAKLRDDLHVSEQDLAAASAYLAGEGLISIDGARDIHPRWSH